ncbi:MAG: isochorismate synthase [Deltaproteobacteria bacterium]|nr:MAG: isochorismate synthase [Deltaproteobacteria bacterium]
MARTATSAELQAPGLEPAGLPLFVWSHPQAGLRFAVQGELERREGASLREVLKGLEGGPWFGASVFDPARPAWPGFPRLRFVRPALLSSSDGEYVPADPAPARIVEQPGERKRWTALVDRALQEIRRGALDKVVLARAIEVQAEKEIDCAALLRALEQRYPSCRTFLVRGDDGAVFLGATPELLCRVEGGRVFAEAVAGSSNPGDAGLLTSNKDLREHGWVVEHIVRALSGIAEEVRCGPRTVRELANVAHLYTPIEARLPPGRGIAEVAAALHPTPAVLGSPPAAARRFLDAHEGLDRGLYGGLVGFVSPERSELAVALRCALVRGRRARLFVGAGIVEGSSPEEEWAETELKARALLEALGA